MQIPQKVSLSECRAIKPLDATGLFLYPLKTWENFWFSDVCRGYKETTCKKRVTGWQAKKKKTFYEIEIFLLNSLNKSKTSSDGVVLKNRRY